jgi:hypothetical protein
MAQDPDEGVARAISAGEPTTITVELVCPKCDDPTWIEARLQTRLTRDSDGTGALALRVRSPKAAHVCDSPTLGLVEGSRER